ncbi:hypothetical protein H2200_002280 [Cladophialophora chaetospira]|uniref:Uncharacterized protein n=1 Tax=Cladophialophora chaetospira TaxID=386627 RepID=A0AA38XIP2_9EURO|nr:hypothetical protein H2200_002280 [Cladophialophora chaetospira]
MKTSSAALALLVWACALIIVETYPIETRSSPYENAIQTYSAQFEAEIPTYISVTKSPSPANMSSTTISDFKPSSPTLLGQAVACPGDMELCKVGNCCPVNSYCTVDGSGNGACCGNGAVCTGLSTPLPAWTIATLPASGAANSLKPAKAFSVLARFLGLGSAHPALKRSFPVLEKSSNTTASDAEEKKGGGGGHGGGGGGGGCGGGTGSSGSSGGRGSSEGGNSRGGTSGSSSTAPVSRPAQLFGIPFAVARQVKAASSWTNKSDSVTAPKNKFMGPNPQIIKADHNLTNSASGMPRPLKLFGLPVALAHRIQAAVSQVEGSAPKSVPKLKFMGANMAMIRTQNQTSGCPGKPRPNPIVSSVGEFFSKVKAALPSNPLAIQARDEIIQTDRNFEPAAATSMINQTDDHKGARGGGWRGRGGGGGSSGASMTRPWQIFRFPARLLGEL